MTDLTEEEMIQKLEQQIKDLQEQLPIEANDNNGIIKYRNSFYLQSNASDIETAEDDYSAFQDITLLHLQGNTIQKIKEAKTKVESERDNLKEELEIIKTNKAHIPELAFRNGKAYCKKCGSDLE